MAELKTKVNNGSVLGFLNKITPKEKQQDSLALLEIFKKATGEKPKLWGTSIIGFGSYHYESTRSKQKGDWPRTAFSPRKQSLTIYIMPGFDEYKDLLKDLGKYKTSVACLYIKRLSDIDTKILAKIIKQSYLDMEK